MKVAFDIHNRVEAEQAAGLLIALADGFATPMSPMATPVSPAAPARVPASRRRGRPAATGANGRGNGHAVPEAAPEAEEPVEEPGQPEAVEQIVGVTHGISPPEAVEEDIEAARARLRAVAQKQGVTWIRPILVECGVERLRDLSETQVRELLHAHA
jgi:hypothetical protein